MDKRDIPTVIAMVLLWLTVIFYPMVIKLVESGALNQIVK